MKRKQKTNSINELRQRIDDLEAFEVERKATERTKDQVINEQRQRISDLEAFEAGAQSLLQRN